MKKLFAVTALSCLALGACTLTQQADTTSAVAKLCAAAPAVINAVAPTAPSPTSAAGVLLTYAQASCNADGTVAAALSANASPTTPAWLTSVLNDLAVAARVAPLVLPLV